MYIILVDVCVIKGIHGRCTLVSFVSCSSLILHQIWSCYPGVTRDSDTSAAHLDLHVGMCAEAVVDQTRRRLVSLPQHEEFLWIPHPFEEPSNYQVQTVGEGQDMELDRLARRSVYDPVICGEHDRCDRGGDLGGSAQRSRRRH